MRIRRSEDRGSFKLDWLNAKYTFSFGEYYDANNMGFRDLRVINHDTISASGGFGKHPHQNMEIITFILRGELEHKDSLGNTEVIKPGMIQIMSAGKGILHSEFNPCPFNETELFQIWVTPNELGGKPSYSSFEFSNNIKTNTLNLIASNNSEDGVGLIKQNTEIYYVEMKDFEMSFEENSSYWVQMIEGSATIDNEEISNQDGVSIEFDNIKLSSKNAKALIFKF